MLVKEQFKDWKWNAATALALRCVRRVQALLNSECGFGRDDGWEIECALTLSEKICSSSPYGRKRKFIEYSQSEAVKNVGYACKKIAENLSKTKPTGWQLAFHIANATYFATHAVESGFPSDDAIKAIEETIDVLNHATTISGSYKAIEISIKQFAWLLANF
ncbi:MAG: hypothetical protein HQM14_18845, partial [SAR324 cluster bacterium]|nr:hypothetical protein [SAR324 cluster bacterium]